MSAERASASSASAAGVIGPAVLAAESDGRMHVSYNKLKTFTECALRYRYAYVERLPRPPIAALAAHRRIHAALASYHALAKMGQAVQTRPLLEAWERLWDPRRPQLRLSREYHEGAQLLLRYRDTEAARASAPAFLEQRLRASFGPYILSGVVDRIDLAPTGDADERGAVVMDYKLDRALPTGGGADEGHGADRQVLLYALLARESLGLSVAETRLLYLRHGVERVVEPTPAALRDTVAWIDQTAGAIRREREWAACVGPQCRTCPFVKSCPAHTGRERPSKEVWEQPALELHPARAAEAEAGPELAAAGATAAAERPRQERFEF